MLNSAGPAGPDAAAVPWEQVEKVVRFGSPGGFGSLGQAAKGLFGMSESERFSRDAVVLLWSIPEGRRVLQSLLDEYGRSGTSLYLEAYSFRGSRQGTRSGAEAISGTGAASKKGRCRYNKLLLSFSDRDFALQYLASFLAHEFQHLATQAQLEREAPELAELFDRFAFLNERRAYMTGYLAAVQVYKGKPTAYLLDARDFMKAPEAYWLELKSLDYPQLLDLSELRDPSAAYESRIRFLQAQGKGGSRAQQRLRDLQASFETGENAAWKARLRQAADAPVLRQLSQETLQAQAELSHLLQ
ncbi:MAG: hypothetical protein WCU88_12415 [Elusimicrobiota bacterium]